MIRTNIREAILQKNLLTSKQLKELDDMLLSKNISFPEALIEQNCIAVEILCELLKENYGIEYCDIKVLNIPKDILNIFEYEFIYVKKFIPFQIQNNNIFVAMTNPFDFKTIQDIELKTSLSVKVFFAELEAIESTIEENFSNRKIDSIESQFINETKIMQNISQSMLDNISSSPTVMLIDHILKAAYELFSSDIHIEPYETVVRVRFRIDGDLRTWNEFDPSLLPSMVLRLKVLSNMDISEKRSPQDGHFKARHTNMRIDYRVSTMPTIHGEKVVIRLIYTADSIISKENLGFFENDIKRLNYFLKSPHGMILVTGPTGSGKTTTLASFINGLNNENKNIVTIEDPVENVIHGINQININPKAGLDFSNILRSILRQDPDIIMVGEIRDSETAQIAIRASITGHLVLSTLHTNDAISTIIRLIDMGIEPYLISSALRCVISQRLVKKICNKCKVEYVTSPEEMAVLNLKEPTKVYRGAGCKQCGFTGYKGRMAVYEILAIDDDVKELLLKNDSVFIKNYYKERGMNFIKDNLITNIVQGNTTVEEMYKVVYGSDEYAFI